MKEPIAIEAHLGCTEPSCLSCSLLRVMGAFIEAAGQPVDPGDPTAGVVVDTGVMVDGLAGVIGHIVAAGGHSPPELNEYMHRTVEVMASVYRQMARLIADKDKAKPAEAPVDIATMKPVGRA